MSRCWITICLLFGVGCTASLDLSGNKRIGDAIVLSDQGSDDAGRVELDSTVSDHDAASRDLGQVDAQVIEGPGARLSTDGHQSSVMTFLDAPADPDDAIAEGCTTLGAHHGASLANLGILFDGNFSDIVSPDANGEIAMLMVFQLGGWRVGQTVAQTGQLSLNLYKGEILDESFWLDASSFDENGEPRIRFEGTFIDDGSLNTPAVATFNLPIPTGPIIFDLALEEAVMVGDVRVDEIGFSIQNGRIEGYLTEQTLVENITRFQVHCAEEGMGDDSCELINSAPQGTPPDALVATLLSVLGGGYDAKINNGVALDCVDDCNALSVCLLYGTTGVDILGIAE